MQYLNCRRKYDAAVVTGDRSRFPSKHSVIYGNLVLVHRPPHTHTLSRKQRNQKEHSRMQGNQSNLENFPSQDRKQKQKSLLTSKIRKQNKRYS